MCRWRSWSEQQNELWEMAISCFLTQRLNIFERKTQTSIPLTIVVIVQLAITSIKVMLSLSLSCVSRYPVSTSFTHLIITTHPLLTPSYASWMHWLPDDERRRRRKRKWWWGPTKQQTQQLHCFILLNPLLFFAWWLDFTRFVHSFFRFTLTIHSFPSHSLVQWDKNFRLQLVLLFLPSWCDSSERRSLKQASIPLFYHFSWSRNPQVEFSRKKRESGRKRLFETDFALKNSIKWDAEAGSWIQKDRLRSWKWKCTSDQSSLSVIGFN